MERACLIINKLSLFVAMTAIGISACLSNRPAVSETNTLPASSPFSPVTPAGIDSSPGVLPTLTWIPLLTPTQHLPAVPTPVVTVNATNEAGAKICWTAGTFQELITSPSGIWTAVVCSSYHDSFPMVRFVGASGHVYPADYLTFYRWTRDEHFAYLLPIPLQIPDFLLNREKGLYRMNLNNGSLTYVLKPTQNIRYPLSISPDDEYLVYAINAESPEPKILDAEVHLHNFISGEDTAFKFDRRYVSLGFYSWSPGGDQVAFSAAGEGWMNGQSGFAMYLIDTRTTTMRVLSEQSLSRYYPVGWFSDEEIFIQDYGRTELHKLNISSNEFVEWRPTATP